METNDQSAPQEAVQEESASPTSTNGDLEAVREENARMKAKLDELLSETKRAKDARRKAEEDSAKAAEEKAKRENDYEQLYKSAQERIESLERERQADLEARKKDRLQAEAMKLASTLTKDTAKAELLAEKISQRLTVGTEGLQVLDSDGNLTVSSVDELVGSFKNQYAFLVDAGSTGGGATGANGGAVKSSKKFNEYSGQELSQLRQTDPNTYSRLKSEFYGA